jgi:hypothetical protein
MLFASDEKSATSNIRGKKVKGHQEVFYTETRKIKSHQVVFYNKRLEKWSSAKSVCKLSSANCRQQKRLQIVVVYLLFRSVLFGNLHLLFVFAVNILYLPVTCIYFVFAVNILHLWKNGRQQKESSAIN